jgi:hypothetical protein
MPPAGGAFDIPPRAQGTVDVVHGHIEGHVPILTTLRQLDLIESPTTLLEWKLLE